MGSGNERSDAVLGAGPNRPAARVAIDLRRPGRVGAVATDARGRPIDWCVLEAEEPGATLAASAVARLGGRPAEVRVLLGAPLVDVGAARSPGNPDARAIVDGLAQLGFSGTGATVATAAIPLSDGESLLAACDDAIVEAICVAVSERSGLVPAMCVDQLVLAGLTPIGRVFVESGPTGLSLIARPRGGRGAARHVPGAPRAGVAGAERVIAAARGEPRSASRLGAVRVLGFERDEVAGELRRSLGPAVRLAPLPRRADEAVLPGELELAWLLASASSPGALASPAVDAHRRSRRLARRTTAFGAALAVAGLLLTLGAWRERAAAEPGVERLRQRVTALRDRASLLEMLATRHAELDALEADGTGLVLPWPPVGEVLEELARACPERVGWEKLTLDQGALSLSVSLPVNAQAAELGRVRSRLQSRPDLANVAWEPARRDEADLAWLQTLSATLRGAPGAPVEVGASGSPIR